MGSFITTIGNYTISRSNLKEFEDRILHVLDIGGMMRREEVTMYDKSVILLTKSSIFDKSWGSYWAGYNYFEDDTWEDMGYNPNGKYVYSNKLGWSVFNRITGICHMLAELYSDGQCYVGGDLNLEPLEMVYWINKEFKTDFDLNHRLDIYKVYQAFKSDWDYKDIDPFFDDLTSRSILFRHTNIYTISSVNKLREYLLSQHTTEETEDLLSGLEEQQLVDDSFDTKGLFHYLELEEKAGSGHLSTQGILGNVSNDDRLYWWTDGSFELSQDCHDWLDEIKQKHRQIMDNIHTTNNPTMNIDKKFIGLLNDINDVYDSLYMFKDSFYDILEQKNTIEVQAAINLMETICLKGTHEIKALREAGDDKWNTWKKIKHSKSRCEMKRFMALLGNKELRHKTLSF